VTFAGRLKRWAANIKRDTFALYLGARDPRVPTSVKVLALAVAAYAVSPIDLIPDFIPVLGYLDDLILVPLGIYLVARLVSDEILNDLRRQAESRFAAAPPTSRIAAALVIMIWSVLGLWLAYVFTR
jgi:uncharacterized membrane protein YkvA (DUF1232 family)